VPELDIKPSDLKTVQAILRRHIPDREVWAFGSRVTGKVKPFSDLDLAVIGSEPIPALVLADLKDAFSESDLPFKVDLVDWAETKENFRKIIETAYVVVQRGKQQGKQ
jgi:predicted nucleotidyltransferase